MQTSYNWCYLTKLQSIKQLDDMLSYNWFHLFFLRFLLLGLQIIELMFHLAQGHQHSLRELWIFIRLFLQLYQFLGLYDDAVIIDDRCFNLFDLPLHIPHLLDGLLLNLESCTCWETILLIFLVKFSCYLPKSYSRY